MVKPGSLTDDMSCACQQFHYACGMVRKMKTAIRVILMAFVAYGIIYQFPC